MLNAAKRAKGRLKVAIDLVREAVKRGERALSEIESKELLRDYGFKTTKEKLVMNMEEAAVAAEEIGFPLVLKACGSEITHKTERNLVRVGISSLEELKNASEEMLRTLEGEKYDGLIVQELIKGEREMVAGLIRDPQFGPCVMFGLGGIFTEVLKDVSFRVAPINENDAYQMMDEIKSKALLGSFRGKRPVNRKELAESLIGIGNAGLEIEEIAEIDVNPLTINGDGEPIAVDALVILREQNAEI